MTRDFFRVAIAEASTDGWYIDIFLFHFFVCFFFSEWHMGRVGVWEKWQSVTWWWWGGGGRNIKLTFKNATFLMSTHFFRWTCITFWNRLFKYRFWFINRCRLKVETEFNKHFSNLRFTWIYGRSFSNFSVILCWGWVIVY